jgi:hypothetical protein
MNHLMFPIQFNVSYPAYPYPESNLPNKIVFIISFLLDEEAGT